MRPKTYNPKKGKGGGRQAMWDALRRGPKSSGELATASGSAAGSVAAYMYALKAHGYVSSPEPGKFVLAKDTGKRAPSTNAAAGTLHDWNLHPAMTGKQLKAIWEKSGLSVAAWAQDAGLGAYGGRPGETGPSAHHIVEMFDGKRPVSPAVEAKAIAFRDRK